MDNAPARLQHLLMRFIVGDFELNLVAMLEKWVAGSTSVIAVDKATGAWDGYHRKGNVAWNSHGNEHAECEED